jgi:hypothetical protein
MKNYLFSLFLVFISFNDRQCTRCTDFYNQVYQVNVTFPGLKSFYGTITLLPNNMFLDTHSISNGHAEAEVGFNVEFSVHAGQYKCLSDNRVRLTGIGYVFKTNETQVLRENGATAVHRYRLNFLNGSNKQCVGTLQFAFYVTGTNPFNSSDPALSTSPVGNVTCESINVGNFQLPTMIE